MQLYSRPRNFSKAAPIHLALGITGTKNQKSLDPKFQI